MEVEGDTIGLLYVMFYTELVSNLILKEGANFFGVASAQPIIRIQNNLKQIRAVLWSRSRKEPKLLAGAGIL
jgi:hypothetical protein